MEFKQGICRKMTDGDASSSPNFKLRTLERGAKAECTTSNKRLISAIYLV